MSPSLFFQYTRQASYLTFRSRTPIHISIDAPSHHNQLSHSSSRQFTRTLWVQHMRPASGFSFIW